MKKMLYIIGIFMVLCSCEDDFLKEKYKTVPLETGIYVSPEWEADSYPIVWAKAGNAKYTISDIPEWMMLTPKTGLFVDGVAYITCAAIQQNDLSQVGIHNTHIKIEVEGVGSCLVPVGYVNEGNPSIGSNPSTVEFGVNNNSNRSSITLHNQNNGILIWQVIKSPQWVTLSMNAGVIRPYFVENIDVKFESNTLFLADSIGEIIISNNSRNSPQYVIKVYYKTGNPTFSCDINQVNFGYTSDIKKITIYKYGEGILNWTIAQSPEWVSISPSQGTIDNNSYYGEAQITITCNRMGLSIGEHTGTIVFHTNDKAKPTYSVNVKCWAGEGNSPNITSIEGIVVSTVHDKSANKIYILTQSPDRILIYNTENKAITNTITLDIVPTCIGLSDDGKMAIVGHNENVSLVDLVSYHVIKSVMIDFDVFDAVLVNEQLCLLSANDYNSYSKWLNLETGTTQILSGIRNMKGKALFRKVVNQNVIVATSKNGSPSGIILIDTEIMKLYKYFPIDLFSGYQSLSPFWLSADGGKIFCSHAGVYRTPINATGDISPIGSIQNHGDYYYDWVIWLDHCLSTNSLWVLEDPSVIWNNGPSKLARYEATNYTFVKSYSYSDHFTSINGVSDAYTTSARYVYANNNGLDIFVIKNVDKKYKTDAWSLEHIEIK